MNQCLSGSASCVNITEHLNDQLRKYNLKEINSAIFSVALNSTEARLYIRWKHDHKYNIGIISTPYFTGLMST